MNSIENTYICLAAPLLLAILVMQKDGRRSLSFVLAGMTASLLSAYITTFLAGAAGVDAAIASHEIAPAVEETMKCLPLVFYLLVFEPEKRFIIPGTDENWLYFTRHIISRMVQTFLCSIPFYFLNKFIYNRLNPEG